MMPPTPFTRKVAPIRLGATSCTLLAKNNFLSRGPGLRDPSGGAVWADLSIRRISSGELTQCAGRNAELPRPSRHRNHNIALFVRTLSEAQCRCGFPRTEAALLSFARPEREQRWSTPSDGNGFASAMARGRFPCWALA